MNARGKVLIVDDDEQVSSGMQALLELDEIDVVTTTSPFEIPMLLGREKPDVMLLDLGLPGLDGDRALELLPARLREQSAILLFSGRPRKELAAICESLNASDCVSKAEDLEVITGRIAFWLERARQRRIPA